MKTPKKLTVARLIKRLKKFPADTEVVVMPLPDDGDSEYKIKDVRLYDGCIVMSIDFDNPNEC